MECFKLVFVVVCDCCDDKMFCCLIFIVRGARRFLMTSQCDFRLVEGKFVRGLRGQKCDGGESNLCESSK